MNCSICIGAAMVAITVLTGCNSVSSWTRDDIRSTSAFDRQKAIDLGHCRQVSLGAVPMPMAASHPAPTSYDVSGRYGHERFDATITPSSGGFFGGAADGMATGAALRARIDAKHDQNEIFNGCMAKLGWHPATQG